MSEEDNKEDNNNDLLLAGGVGLGVYIWLKDNFEIPIGIDGLAPLTKTTGRIEKVLEEADVGSGGDQELSGSEAREAVEKSKGQLDTMNGGKAPASCTFPADEPSAIQNSSPQARAKYYSLLEGQVRDCFEATEGAIIDWGNITDVDAFNAELQTSEIPEYSANPAPEADFITGSLRGASTIMDIEGIQFPSIWMISKRELGTEPRDVIDIISAPEENITSIFDISRALPNRSVLWVQNNPSTAIILAHGYIAMNAEQDKAEEMAKVLIRITPVNPIDVDRAISSGARLKQQIQTEQLDF